MEQKRVDLSVLLQSTKWSAITEAAVKLASPISNILLVRILDPTIFGLVATYTLVTTFAEVFTDGGFQKYLIQHEFSNESEKNLCINTAFWTNFALSMAFWVFILLFNRNIAELVGSPGHGIEIAVLGFQIPLFGLSSIQQSLYRRDFRFKTLAPIRLVTSLIPLVATVPLALILRNSWAIIIGYILKEFINALLLTLKSTWKPRLVYSFKILKAMLFDCLGLMADSFMVWMTAYAGTLIISNRLSSYYLGIYRTGYTTITSYLSLIFVITQPVVFSALSRCQDDDKKINEIYIQYLKYVAYLIIPLGVGVCVYNRFVIDILLGKDWYEASTIIAVTGLTYPIVMLTGQFNSVYFRAKGKPFVSLTVQTLYVICMIVGFIVASNYSFEVFCNVAGSINLTYAIISSLAIKIIFKFPLGKMFLKWFPIILASAIMGVSSIYLQRVFGYGVVMSSVSVILSCGIYFFIIGLIPMSRKDLLDIIELVRSKNDDNK